MLFGDSADCARRRVIPRCTDANRRERHSVFDDRSLEKLVTKFPCDLLKFFQNFLLNRFLDRDLSQMATDSHSGFARRFRDASTDSKRKDKQNVFRIVRIETYSHDLRDVGDEL